MVLKTVGTDDGLAAREAFLKEQGFKYSRLGADGIPRDRYGKPMVKYRNKIEGYRRPSSVAPKPSLDNWVAAHGVLSLARALDLGFLTLEEVEQSLEEWDGGSPTQLSIMDICNALSERSKLADIGSHIHKQVELELEGRWDEQSILHDPEYDERASEIVSDTFAALTGSFEVVHTEATMVNHQLKTLGSTDYILRYRGEADDPAWSHLPAAVLSGGELIIGDLKTGSMVDHASASVQLAIYANSSLYDFETFKTKRLTLNKEAGIVFHASVRGSGLIAETLDLTEGLKIAKMAIKLDDATKSATRLRMSKHALV